MRVSAPHVLTLQRPLCTDDTEIFEVLHILYQTLQRMIQKPAVGFGEVAPRPMRRKTEIRKARRGEPSTQVFKELAE